MKVYIFLALAFIFGLVAAIAHPDKALTLFFGLASGLALFIGMIIAMWENG